jgi:hypothetical protein
MAWLYLIVVTILFYTPLAKLPSRLIEEDFAIQISSSSFTIPFSGSYRLLLYSFVTWIVLWRGTILLERQTEVDLFSWLGLPRKWIYAVRPPFSGQLTRYLADTALSICSVKMLGPILLGVILEIALPWAVDYLIAQVGSAWTEIVAGWLQDVLMGLIENWITGLMNFDIRATLMSFSLLVLTAVQAHEQEQQYRYKLDLERKQRERKKKQKEIVTSSLHR